MKSVTRILAWICIALCLTGCVREEPYRVDTVVRIPVDPTENTQETQPSTEAPEETSVPTEATKPTEKVSSGGKGGSSGGKKPSAPKPTDPPATEPPATESPATEPPAFDPSGYSVGSLEYAILDQINAHRREAGVTEISMSTKLCGIAGLRATEVADLWSHNRPDGRSYTTAISDYGYGFSISAENLAFAAGSGDAAAIVDEWMEASTRDNLLSGSFSSAGIGVFRSGGGIYIVNILVG
ncbi:MAG: hypothetical protein IKJ99_04295 [Oscillospiraceae bacterium]|nr:hypothetical protein [Oscillospiraceae bacterium]